MACRSRRRDAFREAAEHRLAAAQDAKLPVLTAPAQAQPLPGALPGEQRWSLTKRNLFPKVRWLGVVGVSGRLVDLVSLEFSKNDWSHLLAKWSNYVKGPRCNCKLAAAHRSQQPLIALMHCLVVDDGRLTDVRMVSK